MHIDAAGRTIFYTHAIKGSFAFVLQMLVPFYTYSTSFFQCNDAASCVKHASYRKYSTVPLENLFSCGWSMSLYLLVA